MNNTRKILEDLYVIDPSLKEHESELKKVVDRLMKSRPEVKIDQKFVTDLRRELLSGSVQPKQSFLSKFIVMTRASYVIGGTVMAIAIVAVVSYTMWPRLAVDRVAYKSTGSSMGLGPGAFGSLGLSAGADMMAVPGPLGTEEAVSARPQAGGGGMGLAAPAAEPIAIGMPHPMYAYNLKYAGGEFEVENEAQMVYRRVSAADLSSNLARTITGFPNGIVDLSGLSNPRVQNIHLRGDDYSASLDLMSGRISINYDWGTDARIELEQMPVSNMPSERKIIAAADRILGEFNLDTSKYGKPIVDRSWERHSDYVPTVVNVIYPVVLDGNVVYEMSGTEHGLRVGVNVRSLKAVSIWNLSSETYEKSEYVLETDTGRIIQIAERGGLYGGGWFGAPEESQILELGTPEVIYAQFYLPKEGQGVPDELFLPAMRFPVVTQPTDGQYYRTEVIVPLVKEVLDAYDQGDMGKPRPEPFPMPTLEIETAPAPPPAGDDE